MRISVWSSGVCSSDLVRVVVESQRGGRERLDAAEFLRGHVERLLCQLDRGRAELHDLAGPGARFFHELVVRNDRVDQAHVARLFRRILTAQEPDFPRLLLADDGGRSEEHTSELQSLM